jgi:hypothetical protein
MLWKCNMPLLVKAASSVKSMRLLKKRSSHCWRNHGKILGVGENQADSELLPIANGTDAATIHVVPATCSLIACIQRILVEEFSSTHLGMRTFPSSAVYRRRANSTDLHDVMINGVKRSWVRKSMSRTLLRTSLSCSTTTTNLTENYIQICVFPECVATLFSIAIMTLKQQHFTVCSVTVRWYNDI